MCQECWGDDTVYVVVIDGKPVRVFHQYEDWLKYQDECNSKGVYPAVFALELEYLERGE